MGQGAESFPWWGVDGCKGGWICVGLNGAGEACHFVQADIAAVHAAVREHEGEIILLDMPIGFRSDKHERLCDKDARKLIGKRRSSVFPVPCRQAIEVLAETNDIQKARSKNHDITGKCLSAQTWAIATNMYKVDKFLRGCTRAREIFREVHPEVCFRMLNGAALEHNKKHTRKNPHGYQERREILKKYFCKYGMKDPFEKIWEEYQDKQKYPKKIVADDDITDALVAALTAKLWKRHGYGLQTLPPKPPLDSRGLPMEMVFVCGHTDH